MLAKFVAPYNFNFEISLVILINVKADQSMLTVLLILMVSEQHLTNTIKFCLIVLES